MKNNGMPKLERLVGARLLGGFQNFARTVVRTSGHPMAFGLAIDQAVGAFIGLFAVKNIGKILVELA